MMVVTTVNEGNRVKRNEVNTTTTTTLEVAAAAVAMVSLAVMDRMDCNRIRSELLDDEIILFFIMTLLSSYLGVTIVRMAFTYSKVFNNQYFQRSSLLIKAAKQTI